MRSLIIGGGIAGPEPPWPFTLPLSAAFPDHPRHLVECHRQAAGQSPDRTTPARRQGGITIKRTGVHRALRELVINRGIGFESGRRLITARPAIQRLSHAIT
jgi:hypothetical protein